MLSLLKRSLVGCFHRGSPLWPPWHFRETRWFSLYVFNNLNSCMVFMENLNCRTGAVAPWHGISLKSTTPRLSLQHCCLIRRRTRHDVCLHALPSFYSISDLLPDCNCLRVKEQKRVNKKGKKSHMEKMGHLKRQNTGKPWNKLHLKVTAISLAVCRADLCGGWQALS